MFRNVNHTYSKVERGFGKFWLMQLSEHFNVMNWSHSFSFRRQVPVSQLHGYYQPNLQISQTIWSWYTQNTQKNKRNIANHTTAGTLVGTHDVHVSSQSTGNDDLNWVLGERQPVKEHSGRKVVRSSRLRSEGGTEFQALTAATGNARLPSDERWVDWTMRADVLALGRSEVMARRAAGNWVDCLVLYLAMRLLNIYVVVIHCWFMQ